MSEFSDLKAEHLKLAGKSPKPMSLDALRSRVAELRTNAAQSAAAASAPAGGREQGLMGSPRLPASVRIAGEERQLGDAVRMAFEKSGLSAEDWNALSEDDRDARISTVIDVVPDAPTTPAAPSLSADLAELDLVLGEDGRVLIEMLTGLSGPELSLSPGDPHRAEPAEAVRLVRAQFAKKG
ncbi:hypothetical protein HMF7854_04415 [Sphingomonas ginkgonis]|uniref:Uncharacterized protein n=1 Tax=Sphingomonas ginkgonis TaxID=2315330 RepID=A0A3R9YHN0_9SPHN|nr:hypothetical protein [Sphingomonas ginkgonis]RST30152.1 hypothetical protein HMF7854_04415 [Sphingomonas ginkgonis]